MLRLRKYSEQARSKPKAWVELQPTLKLKIPSNSLTVLGGTMLSRRRLRKLMIRSQLITMSWMSSSRNLATWTIEMLWPVINTSWKQRDLKTTASKPEVESSRLLLWDTQTRKGQRSTKRLELKWEIAPRKKVISVSKSSRLNWNYWWVRTLQLLLSIRKV